MLAQFWYLLPWLLPRIVTPKSGGSNWEDEGGKLSSYKRSNSAKLLSETPREYVPRADIWSGKCAISWPLSNTLIMELAWLSFPVLFSILTTFSFEPDYFRISAIPRLSKMLNDNRESTFVSKTGSYMAYYTTKNRCNKSTKFLRTNVFFLDVSYSWYYRSFF